MWLELFFFRYPSHVRSGGGMYPNTRLQLKAASHLRVSVSVIFFQLQLHCLLQSDCIEVKFNVKAAGIMLGRQGIILMAIGFRWLRKCVYLLECGVCEWVVKSLKPYNFSFNQKQIVWMGAWWIIDLFSLKPSQMHLDPSTLFSSCWIYSQKPITRIIIVLNLNSFGHSVKIVTLCIIYFYV